MKKIIIAIIVYCLFVLIVPAEFWVGLINIYSLPVSVMLDIPFFIQPLTLTALGGLILYTLVSRSYKRFNLLYAWLLEFIFLGFTSAAAEILFANTGYFGTKEWIALYVILLSFFSFTGSLVYIAYKKDTRYYFIATGALLLLLLTGFIIFIM